MATARQTASIMDLRRQGGDLVARVKLTKARIVVTSHGRPQAVLVPLADLEILETLDDQVATAPKRRPRRLDNGLSRDGGAVEL